MSCGGCKKREKAPAKRAPTPQTQPDSEVIDAARGLGSFVAGMTGAVGIEPCEGCKRRQKKLDAITPVWVKRLLPR